MGGPPPTKNRAGRGCEKQSGSDPGARFSFKFFPFGHFFVQKWKKAFSFRGFTVPEPPPGSLPLDAAGGSAPRPPFRLARSPWSPIQQILDLPLYFAAGRGKSEGRGTGGEGRERGQGMEKGERWESWNRAGGWLRPALVNHQLHSSFRSSLDININANFINEQLRAHWLLICRVIVYTLPVAENPSLYKIITRYFLNVKYLTGH